MKLSLRMHRNDVPCNGCTLCCRGDIIRLEPDELDRGYQTATHPFIMGAQMLAHKTSGECVYLGTDGCDIHDTAPALCRIADCRRLAARYDFDAARRLHEIHVIDIRVWDRGRTLLEEEAKRKLR